MKKHINFRNIYKIPVSFWLINGLIIAVIWASGQTGFLSGIEPNWRGLIWPPTGIALALILHSGYRNLPGIIVGNFLLHAPHFSAVGPPLVIAFSSGLTTALAAFLLDSLGFQQNLSRLKDLYRLIFFVGIGSTLILATLESVAFLMVQPVSWSDLSMIWLRLWQGHVLGVILFTPLFLTWLNHPPTRIALPKIVETVVLFSILGLMSIGLYITGERQIAYLPFPFLIWAAFRLERRGTQIVSLIIISMAVYFAVSGSGSALSRWVNTTPDATWFFMIAATITAVTVSIANHERQAAKNELQAERDFAQQIMQQMGQGIIITDVNHRFVYVNDAFTAMLGYAPDELLGQQLSNLAGPKEVAVIEEAYTNNEPAGNHPYEVRLQHRNGRYLHAFLTSTPRIQDDQFVGNITVVTDLTERNQTEQKLRRSEQEYKTLFTAATRQAQELKLLARVHAALARELDHSVIFTTVVDALADTFGYSLISLHIRREDTLITRYHRGFSHVAAAIPLTGIVGRVVRTGESALINNISKHSEYIPPLPGKHSGSELCVPLFVESQIIGALNVESTQPDAFTEADLHLLTMLSEHVSIAIARADLYAEVLDNEKRFRALIEHNPATIMLVDEKGELKESHITNNQFGQSQEGNILDPATIHPDDIELVQTTFQQLLNAPGTSKSLIYRHLNSDGGFQWIEKTLTNLFHEPAVQAIVVNARDITERIKTEEALLQAQKSESLGVLAGGIAHDFNNLLVAMMGQISLAKIKAEGNSSIQPHLQKAYAATEKASALTRQLLAYSGHGHFQVEWISLNQVIRDNLHLFTAGLSKKVSIETHLYEPLPRIKADVGQMQQIMMNLLINGAEAIGEQPGMVMITTGIDIVTVESTRRWPVNGIVPSPGEHVVLSITDDGSGMDRHTLAKIFEPFFTTKFTGRGLGLAAVQGIIRGHRGGLKASSTINQGSEFTLFFPVDNVGKQPTETLPDENVLKEKTAVYQPHLASKNHNKQHEAAPNGTILIIDDEAAVRDTLTDLLSSKSLTAITAVNGQDGVRQFQQWQHKVALIILDLSMPGIAIKETITQLRQIKPDIPILVSSGYSETDVEKQLEGLNVAGFLQKPYNVDQLISCVQAEL